MHTYFNDHFLTYTPPYHIAKERAKQLLCEEWAIMGVAIDLRIKGRLPPYKVVSESGRE